MVTILSLSNHEHVLRSLMYLKVLSVSLLRSCICFAQVILRYMIFLHDKWFKHFYFENVMIHRNKIDFYILILNPIKRTHFNVIYIFFWMFYIHKPANNDSFVSFQSVWFVYLFLLWPCCAGCASMTIFHRSDGWRYSYSQVQKKSI